MYKTEKEITSNRRTKVFLTVRQVHEYIIKWNIFFAIALLSPLVIVLDKNGFRVERRCASFPY